ncbi:MAG: hypothetical protein HY806_09010 [Nitrospirae bacterium]|nr:hypothetical protein [Nitrospirota bacterium]
MMRQLRLLSIGIVLILISPACSRPVPSDTALGEVDVSGEPEQTAVQNNETIAINQGNGEFQLKPLAEYSISAVVIGKKSYSSGWQGSLAPVDIALAWGRVAAPDSSKYIRFSQSDRWYYYKYEDKAPFGEPYIIAHSSNNHIIPANKNILLSVKSFKKGDKVTLTGILVGVRGKDEGADVRWNSSLRRNDTGDGSCEVFYVTKVTRAGYVYE